MLWPLYSGFYLFILALTAASASGYAQDSAATCKSDDRTCLMRQVETLTPQIDKSEWRDQTLRELAKSYAAAGQTDKAITLIGQVTDNDTKAMTIRGIGMEAAALKWDAAKYAPLWKKLSDEAAKITHAPSQGIAYTYISMAQAFAGDDDGARKTAAGMQNAALRNKAFGEAAEIQAESGDLANANLSLDGIDSAPYRGKQLDIVSRIFLDKGMTAEAYDCASRIDNAYLKAKAIQRILDKGRNAADVTPDDKGNDF